MNVWIVNPFDNLPQEGNRPQRYWLMARAFVRAGHRVTLWTSDFSHATKATRRFEKFERFEGIEVRMIPTRPYPTNVCWARVRSHRQLARDFEKEARRQLLSLASPLDLMIASVPPLGLCSAAMRVARSCGAKFVCDIQDAWPETFERILPRFILSLLGMRQMAKRLYCEADGVSAVSNRYLELAKARGSRAPMHLAGHAIEKVEEVEKVEKVKRGAVLRLAYAGNMSLSYDLETVIRTVSGMVDVSLDIAGNGPDRARLEALAKGQERKIRFHGYLGARELSELLRSCDVGIVPMFPESCVGVPGKLADYASAGLRVIESLGGECQALVERHGAGVHYAAGQAESLKASVETLRKADGVGDADGWLRAFDAVEIMDGYVEWCRRLAAE